MSNFDDPIERQVNELEFTGKRVVIRDSEEALIGSVLRGGLPVYQRVKEIVNPEMFGNLSYGEVWNAIEKLYEAGLGIDTITVGDQLEREYKLEEVSNGIRSGRSVLSDLRMMGDPRNAESYAENVQDYHIKKKLEEYGKKMVVWSANGRRSQDIMQDVNKLLGEIVLYSSKAQDHITDISKAVSDAWDETDSASRGLIRRVPSGLVDLDKIMNGGYTGGQLVIKAARPGQGKTALLLTETLNMMRDGRRVLFFSLEMTSREIAHRLLSQLSGIPVDRLQAGKLKEQEWATYTNAVEELSAMKDMLTIIDLPAMKIGNIRQLSRREMAKNKYHAIMIDYIQLAEADDKKERRQLEIGQVSRGLKALAKELDVPIISAAQLSRAVEQRADKTPILADLREAGDLEQDADIVMFIYREDMDTPEGKLIVAKHRNGQTTSIPVIFKKELTRFENAVMFRPK